MKLLTGVGLNIAISYKNGINKAIKKTVTI